MTGSAIAPNWFRRVSRDRDRTFPNGWVTGQAAQPSQDIDTDQIA